MPIMRNPFRKQDENVRPVTSGNEDGAIVIPAKGFVKSEVEYKLSEINDSGVFIPPSPTEERVSFWRTSSSRSTTSSRSRSLFDENEPFNISRESFDSYRRSFDISARSPVIPPSHQTQLPRSSLDSRFFLASPTPRASNSLRRPVEVPGTQTEEESENLEDVSLDEPRPAAPKKRGMLSRIIDSDPHPANAEGGKSAWHHFGTRKRGQSGQGAELGSMPKREEVVPAAPPAVEGHAKKDERAPPPVTETAQAPEVRADAAPVAVATR